MTSTLPVIGFMPGDPTGIGPEITAKLLAAGAWRTQARVVIIGDARVLALGERDAGVAIPRVAVKDMGAIDWSRPEIPFIDLRNFDPALFERGKGSPEAGRLCGETLKRMVELSGEGRLDGICFAPLNKGAMNAGGWKYLDEHQMFADWLGHETYYSEMNVIPEFSTFRVSSHVALRKAVDMVVPGRIEAAVKLAHRTMRAIGKAAPRIAVAALNPHGGENGLFGDEEIRIIRPTLEKLRAEGLATTGPLPSDTLFIKARDGAFDAVVMMYHDQGQIATKLLGFSKGVTVTAGLPAVFTTPAHGTAYDIVGQGKADPGALGEAMRIAGQLAALRRQA
jgi:4-hydroxythreonine-4-phosphate dehydrogenase